MWLSANYALACSAILFGLGFAAPKVAPHRRALHWTSNASREAAFVFFLYALWRLFNKVDLHLSGGQARGLQVWQFERAIGLGTERWLQQQILTWPVVVQFFNLYYAVMHVPSMIACLAWLYVRRQTSYARWRWLLALSTGISVVIRLVPVAPPRLLPELRFVDTALLYNQSVYGKFGAGVSDQLAAMPSIHAGWAILIAAAALIESRSRWRWVAVGHAILTMLSIVLTANHWWLDGIVAGLLMIPIWKIVGVVQTIIRTTPKRATGSESKNFGSATRQ